MAKMTFEEWRKKYYPDEDIETLHKMSHAYAAGHLNMLVAQRENAQEAPSTECEWPGNCLREKPIPDIYLF